MPTIDVAIIGVNGDDVETVQIMAVYDDLASAESLEPGYDYYIDYTNNSFSPQPQIGSTYDPETNTFTDPPEDFASEMTAALQTVVSDIQYITSLLTRAANEDTNAASDFSMATSSTDTAPLPSDFATNIWPSIMDYLTAIVGEE